MTSAKLEQGAVCETTQVYKIYSHAGNIQLHSQPAQWERSHQANWEHSQVAWSEHYTIYNAAAWPMQTPHMTEQWQRAPNLTQENDKIQNEIVLKTPIF